METKDLLKRVSDNMVLKDGDRVLDNKGKSIFFCGGGEEELKYFFEFSLFKQHKNQHNR